MSRGLGLQQRRFLAALSALQAERGDGWYYVSGILNRMYETDFATRDTARREQRERRKAQERTENEALAAAGDETAIERVRIDRLLDAGAQQIRSWARRRRHLGRPNTRECGDLEDEINPSRIVATLERRGLIQRRWIDINRSAIRLTDAGRQRLSDP